MWQAFELIHKSFKDGAELYLEGKSSRRVAATLHRLRGGVGPGNFDTYHKPRLTGLKICYRHWTTSCRTVLRR